MPNSKTEHSKQLRALSSKKCSKLKIELGYKYAKILISPINIKKWSSIKNKSEFVNAAISKNIR
jgi:hypothetical protein